MKLNHLKVFGEVCSQNSITAAANKLYIAQPAVSQVIKEIEEHYKVKLFDRISRKLYLTESGKKLLFYANEIIALADETEQSLRDKDEAVTIRVGASITLGTHYMCDYVDLFKQKYPKSDVRVYINSSKNIEAKILANELNFAVIEGVVHSPLIQCCKFESDKLVVICCPDHALLSCDNISMEQLFAEPFLLREIGSGTRELFDVFTQSHDYNITPVWESSSTLALINGVKKGIGISVLPYQLIKEHLNIGTVCCLNIGSINLRRDYYIIQHTKKHLNTLSNDFISMIKSFHEQIL